MSVGTEGPADALRSRPIVAGATLAVLFLAAFVLRVGHLEQSYIIAERQFRSAVLARAFYLDNAVAVEDWRRDLAAVAVERAGRVEPPILERLVAFVYHGVDGEPLWVAGLFSAVFWLLGGLALLRLGQRIVSSGAAIVVVAYYLLVPFGVIISVSFLPEPLMMMMILLSLLASVRYFELPTRGRLLIAAVASGITGLVKPFALPMVVGGFVSLWFQGARDHRRERLPDLAVFLALSFSLGASYYLYGIVVADFLAPNLRAGFLPYLFLDRHYWEGWLNSAVAATGRTALLGGLLGASLLRRGMPRALLLGLTVGYVVFALAYTYPVPLSSHYHVQLIVIVALASAPLVEHLLGPLLRRGGLRVWQIPALAGLGLVLYLNGKDIDRRIAQRAPIASPAAARAIGEIVGHSTRVVHVAAYYGVPLEYRAEISGTYWPRGESNWDWIKDRKAGRFDLAQGEGDGTLERWRFRPPRWRELSIEERLGALGFVPEYFIITDLTDFRRHHGDVGAFLEGDCKLVAAADEYRIYDLQGCVGQTISSRPPDEILSR